MDPDSLFETLVDDGVLVASRGNSRLSEEFSEAVSDRAERVRDDGFDPESPDLAQLDRSRVVAVRRAFEDDPTLLGTFWALGAFLSDVTFVDILRVLLVLDTLQHPPDREEGVPDSFLAIRGDRLAKFFPFIQHGMVYVWREDCNPCDTIVEQFEQLPSDASEGTLRLSVYGPAWAELLETEYDVVGAPTTLFVADGTVDARLVGAHPANTIEQEIVTTRERARAGRE
ncbi:MAG: thioredoxin family protein [Halovenus sp.]